MSAQGNAKVWILANATSDDSVNLAKHYAATRNIPEGNIISLSMPEKETINFNQYINLIYNPLLRALHEQGAMNIIFDQKKDALGREKFLFVSHDIEYLVPCFGVPLKFGHAPKLAEVDGPALPKQFNTFRAAVDSDLSLIPINNSRMLGPLDNPLFNQKNPGLMRRRAVIRISRLDGPDFATSKALVDRAIEGETQGLWGRALIDIGGPHKQGDQWFNALKDSVVQDRWELSEKPGKQRFAIGDRTEDAAIYFGWYTKEADGPFKETDYSFARGAIGFHLHSSSAGSLRTRNRHWTPTLIDRGITATIGNVFEPYLHLTHQPQMIYAALREGKTWGEATYYALTGLSWQAISIGDPLYRPFPGGLESARARESTHPYASILEMRERAKSFGNDSAIEYGLSILNKSADPSLLIEVARLQATQDKKQALTTLQTRAPLETLKEANIPLPITLEIAELNAAWGDTSTALKIFDVLIKEDSNTPRQNAIKARGRKIAMKAADLERADKWAPPPAPKAEDTP
ncbi:MAG: TIGR03790 family protein [Opitutales bacterium]